MSEIIYIYLILSYLWTFDKQKIYKALADKNNSLEFLQENFDFRE